MLTHNHFTSLWIYSFPRDTSRIKRHTTLLSRLNLIKAKDQTEGKLVICRSKYNLCQSARYMTKGIRSRHFWTEVSYLGTKPAFIIIASFSFLFFIPNFCLDHPFGFSIHRECTFFCAPNFCLDRPFGFSVHRGAQFWLRSPSRVFDLASSLFFCFFSAMIILLRRTNCFWDHGQQNFHNTLILK